MKKTEKNMKKKLWNTHKTEDELMKTEQEDRELYLFMRGGFSAK